MGKGSWICTSAPPRCGAKGHSVSPKPRFWFWSVAPLSRPVACPLFLWPHFTVSSIAPPSRFQSLSFIPMAAFHGLVHRSSIPPRSLSFIPMAAIHGLVQRAVFKLVRYSSFSPILLSQMTQCGASGIAACCVGSCSVLRFSPWKGGCGQAGRRGGSPYTMADPLQAFPAPA